MFEADCSPIKKYLLWQSFCSDNYTPKVYSFANFEWAFLC